MQIRGQIRVGLIGCGGISSTHISAVRALGYPKIVAVCDVVAERAARKAAQLELPEAKCYVDYHDLLADGEVNCVIVGTPHYHHALAVVDAARAGKHILTEKPMATTVADCTAMIDAAEEAGVVLGVVFQHRFDPSAVKIKRALDSGLLGRPLISIAAVAWYRDQTYYDVDSWKGSWAQEGGSSLINQSIHTLDRMIWLMGKPVSVTAEMRVLNHEIETEDVTSLTVVFESGAIGTLTATVDAWPSQPERLEVFASKGSACISGTTLERMEAMDALPESLDEGLVEDSAHVAEGGHIPGKACYGTSHVAQFQDFFSAIALGRKPLVDGQEGRKTVSVVCGAYESARTGRRVIL